MMRMLTTNSEAVEGMTDQNRNSAFESFLDPLPEVTAQPSVGDSKAEREQRSLALEKTYVYDVYEQIAPHVIESRHRPWPKIRQFLVELEPGSLVCDVGCGNGKYLNINPDIFKIGSDQCYKLTEGAKELGYDVLACDNMALPFREEAFDAVLSVAVVHHFATTERRVQALRELARILRIGGRLMITAWALEQRHRKFESQDVLVPWHKPKQSSSEDQTSLDKEITSTTTSDDDLLNYHAYTSGMESEPYFVPTCYPRRRHKLREGWAARHHHRGRTLDSRHSSSQSSSDLSSPNETCYSFVRRALQKLSSGKSWDDPHQRCRPPWFLQSVDSAINGNDSEGAANGISGEKQDSLDSNENADDIPIELHDVDSSDICEEFGEMEHSQKCKESACRKYSLQQTRSIFEDSNARSQSAKHLKRSSSGDSPPPPKSKSLSDILSLFAVNFSYSRKSSQDSTSRSSSSSLTKHSSSSSVDSKSATTKHGRSTHHPPNGCVVRSKSSHFTLAKVDEDNEQNAPQLPGPATPPQQRWSVAGYPNFGTPAKASEGYSRRPRSLILGRDVHIPRTLSAEDHKNGNTILPDLDSCLTFYGLTAGMKDEDFLSPPYTKAESNSVVPDKSHCQGGANDEAIVKYNHETPLSKDGNKNDRNASLTQRLDAEKMVSFDGTTRACEIQMVLSSEIRSVASASIADDNKGTPQNCDPQPPCPRGKKSWDTKKVQVQTCSVKNDAWKDLFYNSLIKQIIDQEHLFPYHSMPNLGVESSMLPLADFGSGVEASFECAPPYQRCCYQRRFSQPYTSLQQIATFGKNELEGTIKDKEMYNEASRNDFKKRSFSVDVDQRTLSSSSSLEGMTMVNAKGILVNPKNRCLIRRRSCICNCPRDIKSIKHSRSVGDSTFHCLQLASSCIHSVKVGNNKIIVKEDSLQSDTSVDSDDSVASVIAVRRNPSLDMPSSSHGVSERHCSTCSKDSSNLSDTSVDSEESCVSVIAMPLRRLDNLEGDQEDESLENPSHMANTLESSMSSSEAQSRPKLRCCRQKSLELEHVMPEDDGNCILTNVKEENFTHYLCDPAMTGEESFLEPAITSENLFPELAITSEDIFPDCEKFGQRMQTSISWEKYLDACESLVLDSIFYVNATHADFSGERSLGITQFLPDVCEHYENSIASVQFLNSEIPLMAETCWLDPAGSWKSSESLEDCSDPGELPSLSEDQLDEELKLDIVEGDGSVERNSPNFPPGSPQGRLLEAAVHVANSLQSAMTMVVTSGGRRKDRVHKLRHSVVPEPLCSSILCASGETVLSLPEDQATVGCLPAIILSESVQCKVKSDNLSSELTMHEIEIRELDEKLDNALDSEMSDCIGPSFEMPSDEEENFPECFEDLSESIAEYQENESTFDRVKEDGLGIRTSREDLANLVNLEKSQDGELICEMITVADEFQKCKTGLPKKGLGAKQIKSSGRITEIDSYEMLATSPSKDPVNILNLENNQDGKLNQEMLKHVDSDVQKCLTDLPMVSLKVKDNRSCDKAAARNCSEFRFASKVADNNPSKDIANIFHFEKRQDDKLGFKMLNDVDGDFQKNSGHFVKGFIKDDSEFRGTLKMTEKTSEDVKECDINIAISDTSLNPTNDLTSDARPLPTDANSRDTPKERTAEEQSFESMATGILDCGSEDIASAIELRDLKNLKDGHMTERNRRIREDVINGNVPGHRELLRKMVQEWGHGWLEFQTCDAISGLVDLDDKGQKRRRKSESEAIDLNVRLESRVANSSQISRGRSMEFNAKSSASYRKSMLCEEMIRDANKSVATKLSTSVQYRIQEEEECMTKSNDSSDLSITEPLNFTPCCTSENTTMASADIVLSTLETSIAVYADSSKKSHLISKGTETCADPSAGSAPGNRACSKGENMVKMSSETERFMGPKRNSSAENSPMSKGTKTWTGSPSEPSASGSKRGSPSESNATSKETELMQTSMASSIENHFGNLEFLMLDLDGNEVMSNTGGCRTQQSEQTELPAEQETGNDERCEEEGQPESLSLSTSEDSILSGSENGGSTTYHRFYHVFREGELDHLIEKLISSVRNIKV